MSLLQHLLEPKRCYEKHVQAAVEGFWDALFVDYELPDFQIDRMSRSWQPDLVALNYKQNRVLIVELKGKPPSVTKNSAVAQVVEYAEEFHAQWPDISLCLLVIGPWKQKKGKEEIEYNGYKVRVISIEDIATALLDYAENIFLWSLKNPFGCAKQINLNLAGDLESHQADRGEEEETLAKAGEEERAA